MTEPKQPPGQFPHRRPVQWRMIAIFTAVVFVGAAIAAAVLNSGSSTSGVCMPREALSGTPVATVPCDDPAAAYEVVASGQPSGGAGVCGGRADGVEVRMGQGEDAWLLCLVPL